MTGSSGAAGSLAEDELQARTAVVLTRRAKSLARTAPVEQTGDVVRLVLFRLGDAQHAVEASFVREVLRRPALSMVPWAPPAVLGVANVRGELLCVADVAPLVGAASPPAPGPVIVIDGPGPPLGFLVDEVQDLAEVATGSILPVPGNGGAAGSPTNLLMGVTTQGVVLSASSLLTDTRLSATEPRSGR